MSALNLVECDVLIVGAGITGVAVSWALASQNHNWRIAVIEKEPAPACHASGRNSGVLHAGFNPKPGTLKARFCAEGGLRIREFCSQKGIPFKTVGALVVARSESERHILEELYRRGVANGAPDLQILPRGELQKLEPQVKGCAALHAPSAGIVDSRRLVEALVQEASNRGVTFFFSEHARRIERCTSNYIVHTDRQLFKCSYLINAAGLYADRIAHMLEAGRDYTILPFRGEYYRLCERKARIVRVMVYPVPDLSYPFLGIHFTPTVHGELKVGPNAVLSLGREAYNRTQVNLREAIAMMIDLRNWRLLRRQEFQRLVSQHLRTSLSKRTFLRHARTLVGDLNVEDLLKGPPAGIRAQLVDQAGRFVDDLVIERKDNTLHILNVVSPGLTCALPFADYVASLV